MQTKRENVLPTSLARKCTRKRTRVSCYSPLCDHRRVSGYRPRGWTGFHEMFAVDCSGRSRFDSQRETRGVRRATLYLSSVHTSKEGVKGSHLFVSHGHFFFSISSWTLLILSPSLSSLHCAIPLSRIDTLYRFFSPSSLPPFFPQVSTPAGASAPSSFSSLFISPLFLLCFFAFTLPSTRILYVPIFLNFPVIPPDSERSGLSPFTFHLIRTLITPECLSFLTSRAVSYSLLHVPCLHPLLVFIVKEPNNRYPSLLLFARRGTVNIFRSYIFSAVRGGDGEGRRTAVPIFSINAISRVGERSSAASTRELGS